MPEPLDFCVALKALRDGKRVMRDEWGGYPKWVKLQEPDPDSKMTLPYFYISTIHDELIPWTPTTTDILATDWQIVEKPEAK